MADAAKQLERMLTENGFVLDRQDKHRVYKQRYTGAIWVTPNTPSDTRWARNNLSDFKNFLAGRKAAPQKRSSVIEQMEADKLMRRCEPRTPIARKGKASRGVGIKYVEKVVPVLTTEQRAQSIAASEAAKAKWRAAKIERKQRGAFVESCVEFVRIELEEAMVETDRIMDYTFSNLDRLGKLFRDEEFRERTTLTYEDTFMITVVDEYFSEAREVVDGGLDRLVEKYGFELLKTQRDFFYGEAHKERLLRGFRPVPVRIPVSERHRSFDVYLPPVIREIWDAACDRGLEKWHQSMAIVKYTPTR